MIRYLHPIESYPAFREADGSGATVVGAILLILNSRTRNSDSGLLIPDRERSPRIEDKAGVIHPQRCNTANRARGSIRST